MSMTWTRLVIEGRRSRAAVPAVPVPVARRARRV